MRSLLKMFVLVVSTTCFAAQGSKVSLSGGYFSLNAKASGNTSSISNPSAFYVAYQQAFTEKLEWRAGYSVLMSDFSGSDLGYGLDVGALYYPLTTTTDEKLQDDRVTVKSYEMWRPFLGLSFNQRNFQSVKNSYAGFGLNAGCERYYDERMNLKSELRYVSLSGSGESEATETALFVGVVFKL